jgi:hypothetical protein
MRKVFYTVAVEAVGILVLAVKGAFELTGCEGALANLHRLVHLKMEMKSATFSRFFRGTRIGGESSFPWNKIYGLKCL